MRTVKDFIEFRRGHVERMAQPPLAFAGAGFPRFRL
jgi:hypothetical protein